MTQQTERQTVIGIFDYGVDAQMAAQQLEKAGVANSKIDVIVNGAKDKSTPGTANNTTNADSNNRVGNFFNSMLDNRDESARYSELAQKGSVVTVHTTSRDEARKVAETLDKCGAIDVNERASQGGTMTSSAKGKWTDSSASIPVVEENMQVGKREVETGGVRLRSRIVERPVEEKLRLREEHVHVERNPVNRPANEKDLASFKDGEKIMTEHAEVPLMKKEARVVEEVRLEKDSTSREETVKGTVRKQDVEVDNLKTDVNNRTDRDIRNDRK
ncbi:YsnF/AvaK domain-containing protein [Pontibacter rugosus]|uniref:YsnF/AvaK domain-containing protein n=1 Tax=Pontibacter rugosus TaxID=1745966 RepID=A0ABW3SRV5_9BACT